MGRNGSTLDIDIGVRIKDVLAVLAQYGETGDLKRGDYRAAVDRFLNGVRALVRSGKTDSLPLGLTVPETAALAACFVGTDAIL